MTIKVYTVSGAPRPWRVLLGLAFKGLHFEPVLVNGAQKEHKTEKFLAINPRGTIPVLIDGDVVMRDSIAALAWLDRAYPDKPLFGSTPQQAAVIWQRTEEMAEYLRNAIHGVLAPVFFQGASEATPELAEAAAQLRSELAFVEKELGADPFLGGAEPSAADAVAFPEVRLVQRANDTKPEIMSKLGLMDFYSDYPKLRDWVSRIEALPDYETTTPPHWLADAA